MLFIELLVPPGRYTTEQCGELAAGLTASRVLTSDEETAAATDPGVLDLYESLTDVVVREPVAWTGAGRPVNADGPARFLVTLHVGAWAKETAAHLIASVTRRITEFARGHGDAAPHVRVQVRGVPDGMYGLDGRVVTSSDFGDMIAEAKTRTDTEAPEGMLVDPTCGALVTIEEAVTLERDGVTYGFCCPGCRGRYARRLDRAGDTG
ncbi:hypothetical protein LX16_0593 [Stackebrandtia albiflava]|uniref:TRASH domain-containing protein n=1 Tax=Stackebrandtia albiflava TaxID=406432 RepID=A0A562VAI0_9ACTN|nr:hypothetical protein [Stackebrandtia albiflava]TWJ14900.1 hypothetical protein LX16_0593 [Stackebrandtia albiflava]